MGKKHKKGREKRYIHIWNQGKIRKWAREKIYTYEIWEKKRKKF